MNATTLEVREERDPGIEYRDDLVATTLEAREDATTGERTVSGIAVPWNTDALIRSWFEDYIERFERGAVQDSDEALLYWRHAEPIGKITASRDTDAGWEITASISKTARGDEAYQLVRDGVIREFSIGFTPIDHREEVKDGTKVIVRTKVKVRETSLVPFGAYGKNAPVSQVRERSNPNQEGTPMPPVETDTITRADLDEVRTTIEDLDRKVALIATREDHAPADTRSAGEILKAIVSGDETTIREYQALMERAYTGGTTADAIVKPGWVGDLTRIFDSSSGVLSSVFSTGPLPDSGMSIEYGELDTNSIAVNEQAAEGDDITFGKVALTTKTAPVKTYAGGTQLTRQEIERATVGLLDTSLNALAMAAGVRKKIELRTAYNALVTARTAIAADAGVVVLGATLAAATASHWEDALIEAAIKFEANGLTIENMLASKTVFKKLRSLTVSGERVFKVAKDNASGVLDLPGLSGDFAGLPVRLDTGQAGDAANFVTSRAIRQRETSLVNLSDENIVNLSKTFAVYKYGAIAAEIPSGVVPVKLSV